MLVSFSGPDDDDAPNLFKAERVLCVLSVLLLKGSWKTETCVVGQFCFETPIFIKQIAAMLTLQKTRNPIDVR